MLNQQPTQIVTDPRQYTILIYGGPGVGKTTFCAGIPGHYFLATEAGTKGVQVYGSTIQNWKEFVTAIKELFDARKNNFEGQREITTIVIDTYDKLWEYAAEYICETTYFAEAGKKKKVSHIEDASYGKGYKATNTLILKILNMIALSGYGLVLVSHLKIKSQMWRGQEIPFYTLDLVPSATDVIVNYCDAVGLFEVEEEIKKNEDGQVIQVEVGRWQHWQKQYQKITKHRLAHFPDPLPLPLHGGWQVFLDGFQTALQEIQNEKV